MDSVTPGIGDRGSGIGKDRGDRPAAPVVAAGGRRWRGNVKPPPIRPRVSPRSPIPAPRSPRVGERPPRVHPGRDQLGRRRAAGCALAIAGQLKEGMRPVVCNEHRLVNALAVGLDRPGPGPAGRGQYARRQARPPPRVADVLLGMYREMKADVERDVRDLVASYRDDAFRAYGLEAPPAPAPGDRDGPRQGRRTTNRLRRRMMARNTDLAQLDAVTQPDRHARRDRRTHPPIRRYLRRDQETQGCHGATPVARQAAQGRQ